MCRRIYIVYDGRAKYGSTDDATVLEYIGPRRKVPWREVRKLWGNTDAALYSYSDDTAVLSDERYEGEI